AALNVQTNVTLGYLDYVDQITIAENCTLNVTDLVLYDDISQELSVYLDTDGFDGAWDIFSATNAGDIDTLAGAQFYLAGGSTSYTMGDTIKIAGGSYSLNKTQSGLGIALSKIS
ncbi:MAG: hypothetical protein MR051_07165, partial [Lentisphaeria bacterium]|nr:hypothetical protein [Lentisphaeria bacterium]